MHLNLWDLLLSLLTVLLLLPVLVLFLQVLAAFFVQAPVMGTGGPRPRLAVLIPAHDEASVIEQTLAQLAPQLQLGDRLLVVADNCHDETAHKARQAGAEVVERHDEQRRGKGYALDFGVRHLEADAPEVVLVVDADCQLQADALDQLARRALDTGRPVQGLYLMQAAPDAAVMTQIAEFAWVVKTWVRPLGYARLGLPCQLMGSGMAFPWSVIRQASLCSGDIVEDLKLSLELAGAGIYPLFHPQAVLLSRFPEAKAGAEAQRTRWEHGHLQAIFKSAPRLFWQGVKGRNLSQIAMAMDVIVPPLALLVALQVALFLFSDLELLLLGGAVSLSIGLVGLLLVMFSIGLAWWGWGRKVISLPKLLSVPFYVLGRLPVYARFWSQRQLEWIKTDRSMGTLAQAADEHGLATLQVFLGLAWNDVLGRQPQSGALDEHLDAAAQWLWHAQQMSPDAGVSYGYSLRGGWRDSYHETSGYIATTFFELANHYADPIWRDRALKIAHWLLEVQNSDGSFSNPRYGDNGLVFDTGQDLFGLMRAYEETGDGAFLQGAQRAAEWLVQVADEDGRWTSYEHLDTPHVYNTRTAWALLLMNRLRPEEMFERVARANLDWALSQQQPNGFFDHCAFVAGRAPFTHTIAYATRGLLESGALLGDARYTEAASRCANAAMAHLRSDGFLPGQIGVDGRQAARYCCLTGNCQFGIVWAKLFQQTGASHFQQATVLALDYVMARQDVHSLNPHVRGAIKGSHPIWGRYSPMTFPNWPAKFFVDAMLLRRAWS